MGMIRLDPTVCTADAIQQKLCERLGREWLVGDRLPPVKDLARQLGTGQNNTHLAVQAMTRTGLLVSRRRRGTFVASLPTGTLPLEGRHISIHTSRRRFHLRMAKAFTDVLKSTGAIVHMTDAPEAEADHDADAVVYINPSAAKPISCPPHQILSLVATTRAVSAIERARYDMVCIDEHEGGAMAGRMLRESGCRRACFVGRQLESDPSRLDAISSVRLHGFEAGWGEPLPADRLIKVKTYNPMVGGQAFRAFRELTDRPDGVFAASDDLAYGFLIAAGSHGLMPARDFLLVGFDGQDLSEELGVTDLSTIRVPCEQLGQRAAQLMIDRFSDPDRPAEHVICRCEPHVGKTTHG